MLFVSVLRPNSADKIICNLYLLFYLNIVYSQNSRPNDFHNMNAFVRWTTAVLAVLTTVNSTIGAVLPQNPVLYHHRFQQQQPPHQIHAGMDVARWSTMVGDSSNFPLQDTDAAASFTDNDRSVYDPGVGGECVYICVYVRESVFDWV